MIINRVDDYIILLGVPSAHKPNTFRLFIINLFDTSQIPKTGSKFSRVDKCLECDIYWSMSENPILPFSEAYSFATKGKSSPEPLAANIPVVAR